MNIIKGMDRIYLVIAIIAVVPGFGLGLHITDEVFEMHIDHALKAGLRIRLVFDYLPEFLAYRFECPELYQEEELFLALEVIIQSGKTHPCRLRNIANRGPFKAFLCEK